ncbi:23153_t:CDS:1, partial [Gigaspora margarita]
KHVDKKIQFGSMIFVAITSIQIAIFEGVTEELTRVLVQFIIKYYCDTGLVIKETFLSSSMSSAKAMKQETFLPSSMFFAKVVELAFNFLLVLPTTTQMT